MWNVEFIEGYAADLQVCLEKRTAEGWTIAYILTNGVNRWTVVCRREV